MKKLLEKIRRILRDRRTRKLLTRTVSGFAAIVVFVTTYALVLPAITMEAQADCGIEAHQHDASCYEDVLICEEEESDGHHHDDSCYTSSKELTCEVPEHSHDETCYDEEENLICEQLEHTHDDSCYEERRELTCGLEESDGHHHDSSCYEQVLVCGKEVHTHSEACYHNSGTEAEADEMAVMSDAAYTGASARSASAEETGDLSYAPEYGNENARTGEEATEAETTDSADDLAIVDQSTSEVDVDDAASDSTLDAAADTYVPTLDPVVFEQILNKNTDIYYSHVEDGEVVEDSSEITDWEKIDHDTELGRNDLLRVYLAYTIPAGSLNNTNDIARYRLPSNIHLTDAQVKAINEIENGISGQYINHDNLEVTDTENYHKYLGAEAVEGTRTPTDDVNKYLAKHDGQEYISAVVKVENIYNDQGDYLGQDLVLTFTPYSLQKNQHEYDSNGKPTKAGEVIRGWFTLDFNMEQVDWSEPEVSTYELTTEEASELPAEEAETTDIDIDKADAAESIETAENAENTDGSNNQTKVTTVERSEQTADVVFVPEGTDAQNNQIHEIHTELTRVEETRIESIAETTSSNEETGDTREETKDISEEEQDETDQVDEAAADETAETVEPAAETSEKLPDEKNEDSSPEYKAGTLTSEETGYKITLDYNADAQIPENAYLKVSEITRESDAEAYEACLKEAEKTIPTDNKISVDDKASRFFEIEIFVDEQIKDQTDAQTPEQTDDQNTNQTPEQAEAENNDQTSEQENILDNAQTPEQIDDTNAAQTPKQIDDQNTEQTPGQIDDQNTDQSPEQADAQNNDQTPEQADKLAAEQNNEQPLKENNSETVTRKIEPAAPVKVNIQLFDTEISEDVDKYDAEQYKVIHFAEEGTEEIQDVTAQTIDAEQKQDYSANNDNTSDTPVVAPPTELQFETESFSIYGVIYTVDFHYEVNGKMYEFNIPGGGFVSFYKLVEVLGIVSAEENMENSANAAADGEANSIADSKTVEDVIKLNEVEVSEATKRFVADVASVEFSSPELVWVQKVENVATVGELKEGLNVEYSAELSNEQIEEINALTIDAGDWALISLQPFDTEETLTITLKDSTVIEIVVTDTRDTLGLDGRTLAIVTNKNNAGNRHSLQSNVHTDRDTRGYYLESRQLINYIEIDGVKYCDRESSAWKFEYNADEDAYYISCNGKYLYIDPNITTKNNSQNHSLNLISEKNPADKGTLIKITKDENGFYYFGNEKGTLLWDYGNAYWLSNPPTDEQNNTTDGRIELCLPENPYGSHKASLTAAKDLSNNQSIVIYQKIWNSEKDAYDFFAIDGNGKLQTVWESSDSLYWKEDLSIEWTLKELTDDQGKPTGYLQLYNEKTQTYLAPRTDGEGYAVVTAKSALNDDTMKYVNVSLPGRDSGAYTSRVATWDYNANTTYGLELRRDDTGKVKAGDPVYVNELLKSQEFYFAVRDPLVQKQLTTVDTVDSVSKGIKITMYDFSGNEGWNSGRWYQEGVGWQQANDRLQFMTDALGNADWRSGYYWPGLLERTVEANGYPNSKAGHSLNDIFSQATGKEANHLFIQSVYDTTGYYYYSGFENFAHLPNNSNDFIVYDQVGTPTNQGATNGTPDHPENFFYYRGNFMPFNELDTTNAVLNYYDGGDQRKELSNDDPRKSEDLYAVKGTPNYFFGMIMESKFQQGPNGLSDQGDPMVFEFTGDDDMWVYVDGVLLLDIGGIHDAFHGKINFQTGKITVDVQKTGNDGVTYIREQYWQARKYPDGTDWTNRNDPKQFEFFTDGGEDNGKLVGTYKDYSTHDLKMFYMERGKGASNLKIQFNLPVITGDEFRVTKNMLETASGQTIQNDYADAAFYYKAYIKSGNQWVEYKHSDMTSLTGREAVYDDDEKTPVAWKDDYIFEVKPGGTAVIPVKDSSVEYKVVEVEPEADSHMLDVYNVTNSDQDPADSKSTTGKTVKRRGQVFFDNKPIDEIVNELHITKKLHGNLYKDSNTASGYVEDQNGSPYFEYRIFLEGTDGNMVPYSLGEYYQIDGATGKYVYYDSRKEGRDKRCLAETETDSNGKVTYIYTYADGTTERLPEPKITEHTSQNGSLGDVRPDDRIIVKGLLEGTDFIVDERIDRTHMRQRTEDGQGWEEDWNNKYYYSNTEVNGAYIRGGDNTPVVNLPENWKLAEATIYKESTVPEQVSSLLTGNEAKGTIIANADAEVKVHNQVYNQFELPIKKSWLSDFNLEELPDNAQVTFTLKRYKLETRSASLTLNAAVSGAPAGYDQTYILTNSETGETFTVKYSEMTGEDSRSLALNLPIGTYTVTCVGGPSGYTAEHTKSANTVTVSASDEQGSGGVASPNVVNFTSSFSRQSGSLQVTKKLEGFHGNQSFEKFKALYFVTDMAGNLAKDTAGNTVNPVTLQYSDFNGATTKTITFGNLPAGQYIVREQLNGTAYDDDKFTIVNTADPESRVVTVSGDQPGQVTFTSTYTEVKANPVKVEVVLSNIWNSNIETLYSNTESFRPGDQIVIRFTRKDNNSYVRYRINNGAWSAYTTAVGNSGRDVTEEITLTVPENGVRVEFQDNWTQLKAEHILVRKAETSTQSFQTTNYASNAASSRMMLKAVPRLKATGDTTDIDSVSNTGRMPEHADPKQRYQSDSWSLVVTMKNGGDLLDKDGQKIGTFTIDDGVWSVTLTGANFDGLTADDGENRYYYYIDSVSEKNVPTGTSPSIDNESNGEKKLYSETDQGTNKKLSVTNNLIVADKSITIVKYTKGTSTPLPGAKFILTEVDAQGHDVAGGYTSGEITVDATTGSIVFSGLKPGVYKLEESFTPEGYIKNEGPYYIVINNDGSSDVQTELTVAHTLINKDGTSGSFIIENEPGAALPNTGGPGTNLIYLFGIMLTGLAGAGLVMKRRRRNAA